MKCIKCLSLFVLIFGVVLMAADERPRVREFGIKIGVMEPGQWNAITDVGGVKVGHVTLVEGEYGQVQQLFFLMMGIFIRK